MSIPTVNQLAQTIMREFGESVDNVQVLAQVEVWIQDVFDEIGIQAEWKYLWEILSLSTVASTRVYNVPGIVEQEIAAVNSVDNTPLIKKDRRHLMEVGVNLFLTGKPISWYVEKYDTTLEVFTIGLYPVPDAVYSFSFLGVLQPQELTSTTKLPFSRDFIHLIRDGVRIKFKEDDKDYSGADRIKPRFMNNLLKLKQKNDNPMAERPRMGIMDISSNRDIFVRLPRDHFQN